MEFAAKKTGSNIGLGYIAHMIPFCLHGGDVISFFKIDEYSKRIRQEFKEKNVFGELIQKYLLDNNHRMRLYLHPDPKYDDKRAKEEEASMVALKKALTEEEKQTVV